MNSFFAPSHGHTNTYTLSLTLSYHKAINVETEPFSATFLLLHGDLYCHWKCNETHQTNIQFNPCTIALNKAKQNKQANTQTLACQLYRRASFQLFTCYRFLAKCVGVQRACISTLLHSPKFICSMNWLKLNILTWKFHDRWKCSFKYTNEFQIEKKFMNLVSKNQRE